LCDVGRVAVTDCFNLEVCKYLYLLFCYSLRNPQGTRYPKQRLLTYFT